jgi:hypothetical protein
LDSEERGALLALDVDEVQNGPKSDDFMVEKMIVGSTLELIRY